MNKKTACLIKYSLNKKIKTKWFLVVNILLAILLISLANIDRIISFFGGDFEDTTNIYVVDDLGLYDNFKTYFNESSKVLEDIGEYKVSKPKKDINKIQENLKEDEIIVKIKPNENNYIEAEIVSYNNLSMVTTSLISNTLNTIKNDFVITKSNLTSEQISSLTSNVEISKTTTNPDVDTYKDSEYKDILSSGIITIFIIPFFIFIMSLTQMLGAEINDEKSSRGMEIIISSVPAKTHFLSKIIASLSFVLLQTILIFSYATIGIIIRKLFSSYSKSNISNVVSGYISEMFTTIKSSGLLDVILKGLPIFIVLIIVSFLAYAIISAVLASMTTNIEDYQQIQTPLMMIIMAGYFLAIMANAFEGALFIKIMAFVPFISVLLAPVMYLLGEITITGLIISTLIMIVSTIIIYYFGIRIYKVGILNYSSTNLWQKIIKSIKKENV